MQTANVTELCDVESPFYVETKRAHGYVTSSHAAHYDIHLSVNNVRSEPCVLSIVRVRRSSIIRSSFGIVPGNDRVPSRKTRVEFSFLSNRKFDGSARVVRSVWIRPF